MKAIREWLAVYKHRAYLYGCLVAAGPLLVGLGITTGPEADLWIDFAGAVLMISGGALALANPTPDHDGRAA